MIELWLARDDDGELYLFKNKPINNSGIFIDPYDEEIDELEETIFPEITHEDSPIKFMSEESNS